MPIDPFTIVQNKFNIHLSFSLIKALVYCLMTVSIMSFYFFPEYVNSELLSYSFIDVRFSHKEVKMFESGNAKTIKIDFCDETCGLIADKLDQFKCFNECTLRNKREYFLLIGSMSLLCIGLLILVIKYFIQQIEKKATNNKLISNHVLLYNKQDTVNPMNYNKFILNDFINESEISDRKNQYKDNFRVINDNLFEHLNDISRIEVDEDNQELYQYNNICKNIKERNSYDNKSFSLLNESTFDISKDFDY